ncbi:Zn-dependent M28 family amino/carboxypeptidase [Chromatocurvus halotolerans]|uniref:Zn-dependent M28 family amino/carboxypeptidase n=2 Tax=Chromatocurvus halotolerans TaxID=1132028 RepID=A0A4R2KSG3_9GAMM|nr:Zn-dependent M28 family amino/carboxypeptidase [Chromatocurvus halotolerans]
MTRSFNSRPPAGPGVAGLALCAVLLSACGGESRDETASQAMPPAAGVEAGADQRALDVGLAALSADRALTRINTLASDEFGGRQPGTQGEELTLNYLVEEFRAMGLEPGNPDGSYLQKVPLVGITADPSMQLTLSHEDSQLTPSYGDDYVAWTSRVTDTVSVDAELVFAGYGVQAPEFDWDDFKDVDVRDKVIVVLINDPPLADEDMFGGPAMTYYGRWTYKFEKAAELGAAGVMIIHETGPAGYPWEVIGGSGPRERFDLVTQDRNMDNAAVEGWLTVEQAEAVFDLAGQDLNALKAAALQRDFRPVPLGVNAQLTLDNSLREVDSYNVVARLPGSDPALKDEYVAYMAHWDHVGTREVDGETVIYNGAVDNASGTAGVLEVAQGFAAMPEAPARSLLFIAVTAEEQGLLGSRHYGENPLYPLADTLAVINLDGMNVLGPTTDLVIVGLGNSTLDDVADAVAAETGRTLKPDPEPEKGYFYRSDHFSLAKFGVPALFPNAGVEFIDRPEGWGVEMRERYTAEDYHKPSDTVRDNWNLEGLVEDARFFLRLGYRVANDPVKPEWKPGTEFRAIREASLQE